MNKKVNLYIFADIDERLKQVRERMLNVLVNNNLLNNVEYSTNVLTNDIVDKAENASADYSIIINMKQQNCIDESVQEELKGNCLDTVSKVRLWEYDSVIFPALSLDLLMFLSSID